VGTQPSPGLPETFTWNQFLIVDDEPLPVHTATNRISPAGPNAVERIIPLVQLRDLSSIHSEVDECGALNALLEAAARRFHYAAWLPRALRSATIRCGRRAACRTANGFRSAVSGLSSRSFGTGPGTNPAIRE